MRDPTTLPALLLALLLPLAACRSPQADDGAKEPEVIPEPTTSPELANDVSVEEGVEFLERFWWLFQEGDEALMAAAVRENPDLAKMAQAIVLQDLDALERMPHLDGLMVDRYGGFVSRQDLTELAARLAEVRHQEIPGEDVEGYQLFMKAFHKAFTTRNLTLMQQLAMAEPNTDRYIDRILVEAEEASQPSHSHVLVPWNRFTKIDAAQLVTVAFALGAARFGKDDVARARLSQRQLDKIAAIWARLYARGLECAGRMSRGRLGKEWKDEDQSEALHRLLCAVKIAHLLRGAAADAKDSEASRRLGLSLQAGAWGLSLLQQDEEAARYRAAARESYSRPLPWPPHIPPVLPKGRARAAERAEPLPTSMPAAPPPRTSPLLVRTGRDKPTVKRFGKEDFAAFQRELYILWSTGQWPLLAALAREVEDPADYFYHFVRMADLAAHPGMRDFGFDLHGRQVFLDSADMLRLGFCLLAGVQGGPGPQAARLTGSQAKGVFAVWTSLYNTSLLCIGAASETPRCDFAEPRNKLKQCHEIAGLLGAPLLDGLSFAGEAWLAERQGDTARSADLRHRAEELLGKSMSWPPISRKAGRYETLTPVIDFQ